LEYKSAKNTYFSIQSWMGKYLDLSGNDLMVYAIIFSMTQDGVNTFWGSIDYICKLINSNRSTVRRSLEYLVDRKLILKEKTKSDKGTNVYRANIELADKAVEASMNDSNEFNTDKDMDSEGSRNLNDLDPGNSTMGTTKIQDNNKDNNIENIKEEDNDFEKALKKSDIEISIIKYFNKVCGTTFHLNQTIKKKIQKIFSLGFNLDDIKHVIDFKFEQWGAHPYVFQNGMMSDGSLTPTKILGDNFESYFNEYLKNLSKDKNQNFKKNKFVSEAVSVKSKEKIDDEIF